MTDNFFTRKDLYPWHEKYWHNLPVLTPATFPHALLIHGVTGIGKKAFAFYLSKALLCRNTSATGQPCHHCRTCVLFAAGNHPDFNYLTVPEDKSFIPVDSVREVIQWSVLSSQMGGKKIVLIEPAHLMQTHAANSLLKTLEEPSADTVIILLTDNFQSLLPTIRSRCQTYLFNLPDRTIALQWLAQQNIKEASLMLSLASGAPLKAKELSGSKNIEERQIIINSLLSVHTEHTAPVTIAAELKKLNTDRKQHYFTLIYWFDSLVTDCVRLQYNCKQAFIDNIDVYERLVQLKEYLYLPKLLQLSQLIHQAYRQLKGQINAELLLESLLIQWQHCNRKRVLRN